MSASDDRSSARHVGADAVALRIVATDSRDLRSNSPPTYPFLHHPQKKYSIADEARSLTRQALKLRDRRSYARRERT
jgi:hypothetical protein